jgi:hypothetical protein
MKVLLNLIKEVFILNLSKKINFGQCWPIKGLKGQNAADIQSRSGAKLVISVVQTRMKNKSFYLDQGIVSATASTAA